MTTTTNKISHTADHLETLAKESAKDKQVGNNRALLLQNLPGAREVRSFLGGTLGILESTGDALYRTLTLAARPQDLKNSGKIIRNGIKTIIAETPQIETNGAKEYIQNLRASKLQRDSWKQYHEPYLDDSKFFDTHGTDLSLAPKKSDHWFKKGVKGIPFMAGKIVKTPVWAASTVVGALTDSFRWMKAQKLRDLITLKFTKTSRNKTSHAWKKLTSRAYKGNTSGQNTIQETKKEESDTNSKKSLRSRLRPFGKKKHKQDTKKSENTKIKEEATTLLSTPPEEGKIENKQEIPQEKNISNDKQSTEKEKTIIQQENIKGKTSENKESNDRETINEDKEKPNAVLSIHHKEIGKLKQAFQQKDKEKLEEAKSNILKSDKEFQEFHPEAKFNEQEEKIIHDMKAVAERIRKGEYDIKEGEVEQLTEEQLELLTTGHSTLTEFKQSLIEKDKNKFKKTIDKIGKAEESFRNNSKDILSSDQQSMLRDIKHALKEARETKFDETRK